jgi:predicted SprT family Zn-dependent metalloprotease
VSVDTAPQSRRELLEWAAAYAKVLDVDVPAAELSWRISERAKRRAGGCRYDPTTEDITIVLTWDAFEAFGWEEFKGTIRHELVHAWEFHHFGESGHGERFHRKAADMDAPRHCRTFTDGRLELVCLADDCAWNPDRHRASKPVKFPDDGYRCGDCGSRYVVRHVDSGRTWRTYDGYQRARDALGDDW